MKRVVHIITGLNNGGAETMLYKLLCNIDRSKYDVEVVSMTDKGVMGEKIENLGIKVHTLSLRRGVPSLSAVRKTMRIVKNADIVQSWMYHADLLAFVAGKLVGCDKIIWGIRRSNLDKGNIRRSTLVIARINALLSRFVDAVVSCSQAGTASHEKLGYQSKKIVTIPNGFDLDRFHRIANARADLSLSLEVALGSDDLVISMVARWDEIKGHRFLIESLSRFRKKNPIAKFRLILCGTGVDHNNKQLVSMLKEHSLEDVTHLLGRREDIPKIMSATDIYVSASKGEGFSNVIGEAMACECVCVVTDVGDSSYIVGDTGLVVKSDCLDQMVGAVEKCTSYPDSQRKSLGKLARQRVVANFEIRRVTRAYESLYES